MRVRAIVEGRWDWREEGPGNGSAGASGYHGSIVQGDPGAVARKVLNHRTAQRKAAAHMRATRVRAPEGRTMAWWRTAPPCGFFMPRVGASCARHVGHADKHRSQIAILADQTRSALKRAEAAA